MPDPLKQLILIAELRIALGEKLIKKAEIGETTATLSLVDVKNLGRKRNSVFPSRQAQIRNAHKRCGRGGKTGPNPCIV